MIRSLLSFWLAYFRARTQLQLEILLLRKQLEIALRSSPKLRFRRQDRVFLSFVTNLFIGWRDALLIVQPETLIKWHRQGFKMYWTWKSRHSAGRPKIPQEQIDVIRQMASDNPSWGAPRIHGEMLKLGFDISESSVLRYMPKKSRRANRQRWKTFLQNHATQIVALDFFTVPSVSFRILYVLVFLSHHRRRLVHFNVTAHPTSEWATQQLRNAFYNEETPRFLLMDNDSIFDEEFIGCVSAFSTPIRTALHSPWQNGYAERVIGSIRRECLDHLIIVNEHHLRRFLKNYIHYYHNHRTHLGIGKDSPMGRQVDTVGEIQSVVVANGLHHYYYRKVA